MITAYPGRGQRPKTHMLFQVRVRAINAVGPSEWSPPTQFFKTLPCAPNPIPPPVLYNPTALTMDIAWINPSLRLLNGSPLVGFTLVVSCILPRVSATEWQIQQEVKLHSESEFVKLFSEEQATEKGLYEQLQPPILHDDEEEFEGNDEMIKEQKLREREADERLEEELAGELKRLAANEDESEEDDSGAARRRKKEKEEAKAKAEAEEKEEAEARAAEEEARSGGSGGSRGGLATDPKLTEGGPHDRYATYAAPARLPDDRWKRGGVWTYTVSGLLSGTKYRFEICARNEVGAGPFCPPSLPMWTASPVVPAVMRPPVISNLTPAGMEVTWSPPKHDGGSPIEYYQLRVSRDGGPWQPVDQKVRGMFILLENLAQRSKFSVQVAAANVVGRAEWSRGCPPARLPDRVGYILETYYATQPHLKLAAGMIQAAFRRYVARRIEEGDDQLQQRLEQQRDMQHQQQQQQHHLDDTNDEAGGGGLGEEDDGGIEVGGEGWGHGEGGAENQQGGLEVEGDMNM